MITLTNPQLVKSVLGGTDTVEYDHMFLAPITIDAESNTINAAVKITSNSDPDMQALLGNLTINTSTGILVISVQQLDFYRRIQLSAGQITTINSVISGTQNSVENGILNVGVVSGTQSTGV